MKTRSNARIAPNPATDPTATPATAPELNPEPLFFVVVAAVSATAVLPAGPTVTVCALPATVWTAMECSAVVLASADVVVLIYKKKKKKKLARLLGLEYYKMSIQ